jgi:hypothetical protein
MKRTITCLVFSLLAAALPLTTAAMNNKDILKMHKAGLTEEIIVAAMQKEKPDYDTGADALIELKTAGVSEKLIQQMIARQSGGPAVAAPSAPPAPAALPADTGVFWQEFPSIAPAMVAPVSGRIISRAFRSTRSGAPTARLTIRAARSCRSTPR